MMRLFGWIWDRGFFVILPIVATLAIMGWVGGKLVSLLGPGTFIGEALKKAGLQLVAHESVATMAGWILVLVAIWVLGILVKATAKGKIEDSVHDAVEGIPIVSAIYKPIAQVVGMLKTDEKSDMKAMKAVLCSSELLVMTRQGPEKEPLRNRRQSRRTAPAGGGLRRLDAAPFSGRAQGQGTGKPCHCERHRERRHERDDEQYGGRPRGSAQANRRLFYTSPELLRLATDPERDSFSGKRMEGAPRNPLRRDHLLRGVSEAYRQSQGIASGGRCQRPEPDLDRHSLPPRHRRQRHVDGVRRRPCHQGAASRARRVPYLPEVGRDLLPENDSIRNDKIS